jgi:hypothetical protein
LDELRKCQTNIIFSTDMFPQHIKGEALPCQMGFSPLYEGNWEKANK